MKPKLREWTKRYLPAELFSTVLTLLSASLACRLTENGVTTALIGTWAGNFSYFGYIIITDVFRTAKERNANGMPYTGRALLTNVRAIVLEFGIAEVLDSFFIRPMLMYCLPALLSNLSLGVLLAKIAADITFYVPVIASYEFSKKYLKSTR